MDDAAVASPATRLPQRAIDARALSKLRWRCRRGLLENDLLHRALLLARRAGHARPTRDGLQRC